MEEVLKDLVSELRVLNKDLEIAYDQLKLLEKNVAKVTEILEEHKRQLKELKKSTLVAIEAWAYVKERVDLSEAEVSGMRASLASTQSLVHGLELQKEILIEAINKLKEESKKVPQNLLIFPRK